MGTYYATQKQNGIENQKVLYFFIIRNKVAFYLLTVLFYIIIMLMLTKKICEKQNQDKGILL